MAHEITLRRDGTSEAAFSMTPAWHGLGTVLDHPMSSAEALTAAQLDWDVLQRPAGMIVPKTISTPEGDVEGSGFVPVPDWLVNVRDDTNDVLGLVSKDYKVVQNREAFQFLDALIQDHQMEYEAAFSLQGGKRVCLLGRLPETDTITQGDDIMRYVLLSTSHDGTSAIKFGPTSVRVVCANTYKLALDAGGIKDLGGELSIRHGGDIEKKLDRARQIIAGANAAFDVYADQARAIAAYRFTHEEWTTYLDVLCPTLSPLDPDHTDQRARKISETRAAITDAYHGELNTVGAMARTAWAAFNAVTEHIDHLPRRGATMRAKAEARFNVALYGPGRDMKKRAFETAARIAGLAL